MARFDVGKLDSRNSYVKEFTDCVWYRGYRVTRSGYVFNKYNVLVKPKFAWKGKRIDYIYMDINTEGKRKRVSYYQFVFMAWNPELRHLEGNPDYVVRPKDKRFNYHVDGLELIERNQHIQELAEKQWKYSEDERLQIVDTFNQVKDYMTAKDFAKRLGITVETLYAYRKAVEDLNES